MSSATVEDVTTTAAAELGAPGSPDAARCSGAAIEALNRVASAEMRLTQFQLDLSSRAVGAGQVVVSARIDKRTRSIVFASAEARVGGDLVFRAQGLFSRRG